MARPSRGEFSLIQSLVGRAGRSNADRHLLLGPGDDAAVLRGPGREDYVWTVDSQVEGVHFLTHAFTPEEIGWRALAVNLSDIAAMGARPVACLVSLMVPERTPASWLKRLYGGLNRLAGQHNCLLAGGNLSKSPHDLVIDISVIGRVLHGRATLRSGARPGDGLYVSGPLGNAGVALDALLSGRFKRLPKPQRDWLARPRAECPLGWALGGGAGHSPLATAMIDLSDGLSGDLTHLVEASGVAAEIEEARLPVSKAVQDYWRKQEGDALQHALHDGEDYRLLFTARPASERRILSLSKAIRRIGTIKKGDGIVRVTQEGRRQAVVPRSWDHFRR